MGANSSRNRRVRHHFGTTTTTAPITTENRNHNSSSQNSEAMRVNSRSSRNYETMETTSNPIPNVTSSSSSRHSHRSSNVSSIFNSIRRRRTHRQRERGPQPEEVNNSMNIDPEPFIQNNNNNNSGGIQEFTDFIAGSSEEREIDPDARTTTSTETITSENPSLRDRNQTRQERRPLSFQDFLQETPEDRRERFLRLGFRGFSRHFQPPIIPHGEEGEGDRVQDGPLGPRERREPLSFGFSASAIESLGRERRGDFLLIIVLGDESERRGFVVYVVDGENNQTYEQLLALQERLGNVSRGVPQQQVDQISHLKYQAGEIKETFCTVCLTDFISDEDLRSLPCGHVFHQQCVDTWLTGHCNSCPLCRLPPIQV